MAPKPSSAPTAAIKRAVPASVLKQPVDAESLERFRHNMLELHEQKAAGADVDQKISDLDARIDALVYELYGLTDDEIAIAEASVRD